MLHRILFRKRLRSSRNHEVLEGDGVGVLCLQTDEDSTGRGSSIAAISGHDSACVALDRLGVTCPCHEWHFVLIRQIHEFSAPRFLIKLDVSGCELH